MSFLGFSLLALNLFTNLVLANTVDLFVYDGYFCGRQFYPKKLLEASAKMALEQRETAVFRSIRNRGGFNFGTKRDQKLI